MCLVFIQRETHVAALHWFYYYKRLCCCCINWRHSLLLLLYKDDVILCCCCCCLQMTSEMKLTSGSKTAPAGKDCLLLSSNWDGLFSKPPRSPPRQWTLGVAYGIYIYIYLMWWWAPGPLALLPKCSNLCVMPLLCLKSQTIWALSPKASVNITTACTTYVIVTYTGGHWSP